MTRTQRRLVSLAREYAAVPDTLQQERQKLAIKLDKMLRGAGYHATASMFPHLRYVLTKLSEAKTSLDFYDTEVFAKETVALQSRIGVMFNAL